MINSTLYDYVDVLDKAADASWTRNELISNNIANVDTTGYKRKDVEFATYLEQALVGPGSLDSRVNKVASSLEDVEAHVYTDNANLSYRMDGNNVDIDTENTYLAENQIRYNALVDSMSQEFSRFKTVLSK